VDAVELLLAEVDLAHAGLLMLVGLLAGVVGGMLGIGGGIVMIPALVFIMGEHAYGENSFHIYKLAAITTSIVVSVPAAWRHLRARAVVIRMIPPIAGFAVVGVAIGVALSGTMVGEYTRSLRRLFGGMLLVTVLVNVLEQLRAARGERFLVKRSPMPRRWLGFGSGVGLPAGVLGGLLGVGGGIWAVPVQRQLFGIRLRNAIANSSLVIIAVSIASSALLTRFISRLPGPGGISPTTGWMLALFLAPGAVLGGFLGADLTHRLPIGWLRILFQLALAGAGVRLLLA
jgi:hypothetical protein